MPGHTTAAADAILAAKSFRFATLWKIERTDGEILYFTDHNENLVFDGNTYTPAGGMSASARQKQDGLQPDNLEVVGMLSAAEITYADLRGGRYREAEVTEYLVDWEYPFAGAIVTSVYWIAETTFDGERWQARVEGIARWLNPQVGNVYSRVCRHVLGDAQCGVALAGVKDTGTVSDVTSVGLDKRRIFKATGLVEADDYYNYGYVEWTSGNNDGLIHDVIDYDLSDGQIWLQIPAPFDIAVNDTFDIYAGCDKLAATCKDKFSNLVNFGGFSFIPGTDKMLATPKAK